jgi:hypothetical protein
VSSRRHHGEHAHLVSALVPALVNALVPVLVPSVVAQVTEQLRQTNPQGGTLTGKKTAPKRQQPRASKRPRASLPINIQELAKHMAASYLENTASASEFWDFDVCSFTAWATSLRDAAKEAKDTEHALACEALIAHINSSERKLKRV